MMSGVRAVTRSAEPRLPAESPRAAAKRDETEEAPPRRSRRRKPADEIAEGDPHQLDVEA
jgi:hypothetical protein